MKLTIDGGNTWINLVPHEFRVPNTETYTQYYQRGEWVYFKNELGEKLKVKKQILKTL
jgi:hypothetical protein